MGHWGYSHVQLVIDFPQSINWLYLSDATFAESHSAFTSFFGVHRADQLTPVLGNGTRKWKSDKTLILKYGLPSVQPVYDALRVLASFGRQHAVESVTSDCIISEHY